MDARPLNVNTIFGQDRRHIVPLFQRPYVWKEAEQWEPFWEDVRSTAERILEERPVSPHFMGAIVLDQQKHPTGNVESRLVIDGQQRLTTIQLLLEAFCDYTATIPAAENYRRALLKLTRNDDPLSDTDIEKYKVWPTNVDQDHFRRVMEAASPDEVCQQYGRKPNRRRVNHPIGDAYLYFYRATAEWMGVAEDDLLDRCKALYTAIRDYIRMVVIDLSEKDDAQMIFETLNARGTPLLPSDLVKNYLFHRAQLEGEEIKSLYRSCWKPFDDKTEYWREELGRGHAKRARIDLFLLHYLTLITGDEIKVGQLYTRFRQQAIGNSTMTAREHLERMARYSTVYSSFDEMPTGTRESLFFDRLKLMDIATVYPFLMELFLTLGPESEETREVLVDLESFLARRMVCHLSTRGYNRFFIDLLGELSNGGEPIAARVRRFLLSSQAESSRWPKDAEFKQAWLETPVYRLLVRQRIRMVLEALEQELHSGKTEKVRFDEKLTIEHLLPRDWRKHWALPQGVPVERAEADRERHLHTLGNLTLLTKKLNPSLSNGAWDTKRSAILKHSGLNLNRGFQELSEWDENRIRERGEQLFEIACRIWPRMEG